MVTLVKAKSRPNKTFVVQASLTIVKIFIKYRPQKMSPLGLALACSQILDSAGED